MATNWTKEQISAIEHKKGGAIVSAAAGSGKTATLVERVIRLLTDTENPVKADRIAVVTFTQKASEELRQRFDKALKDRIRTAKDRLQQNWLREQQMRLQDADISTISSFCFKILRENVQHTDLSAGFSLMDETQSEILKLRALDEVLDCFYEDAEEEDINIILNRFGGKSDKGLSDCVFSLFNFTRNLNDYDQWLEKQKDSYLNPETSFTQMRIEYFEKLSDMFCQLEGCAETIKDIAFNHDSQKLKDYGEKIVDLVKSYSYISNNDKTLFQLTPDELCSLPKEALSDMISRMSDRLPQIRKSKDLPVIPCEVTTAAGKINELRKIIPEYVNNLYEFYSDIRKNAPIIKNIVDLCKALDSRFSIIKRERNSVDFSDVEQITLKLLSDEKDREKPSRVAKDLSDEFDIIIVDEFQDSNRVQYDIFKKISKNEENLFFVGDIKQCIYHFRAADPTVFAEICQKENYTYLPMNKNFRSRTDIVSTVNGLFTGTMTKKLGGENYGVGSELIYGAKYFERDNIPAELYVFDSDTNESDVSDVADEDGEEAVLIQDPEAEFVAAKIKELVDTGFEVSGGVDKDDSCLKRPCNYGDFAVLMRTKTQFKVYAEAMKRQGIPVIQPAETDYLALQEITLILNFLSVIDNPYRDREMLAVLMSPLFMFSAEMLGEIRLGVLDIDTENTPDLSPLINSYKQRPLYSCVKACAERVVFEGIDEGLADHMVLNPDFYRTKGNFRCIEFVKALEDLRNYMQSSSVSRLVQKIYDSTDFLWVMSMYEGGERKISNLRKLMSYINSFEQSGGGILSDFLSYIARIKKNKKDLAQAAVPEKKQNAVQIMTIHASKGLEFPVCFVSDCGKGFNKRDIWVDFLFSREYGIGAKVADRKTMTKYPTLYSQFVSSKMEEELVGEEIRLLYVATTRAKERLFLSGKTKSGLSRLSELREDDLGFSEEVILKSRGYLDLILKKLACLPVSVENGVLSFPQINLKAISGYINPGQQEELDSELKKEIKIDENVVSFIKDNISFVYPRIAQTKIPAKFTATEIAKNNRLLEQNTLRCELYTAKPSFLREEATRLDGKQRGDAYHKAMEHIDFSRVDSIGEVKSQLEVIFKENKLSKAEYECVEAEDLFGFFNSRLGQRLIHSERIYREFPIFHRLDMSRINAKQLGLDRELSLQGVMPTVQGIVDMFFIEEDGIVLVDYKTDRNTSAEKLIAQYKPQIDVYREALSKMFDKEVKEAVIYSFEVGEVPV